MVVVLVRLGRCRIAADSSRQWLERLGRKDRRERE